MRKLLLGDLGTKGLALGLAVVVWAYIYGSTEGKTDVLQLPLEIQVPADVARIQAKVRDRYLGAEIGARFSGPKNKIEALRVSHLRVRLSLEPTRFPPDREEGTLSIELVSNLVEGLPPGLRVEFEPASQIELRFWKYTRRKVRIVSTDLSAHSAKGCRIQAAAAQPEEVLVYLPSDLAVKLDEKPTLQVEPVRLPGALNQSIQLPARFREVDLAAFQIDQTRVSPCWILVDVVAEPEKRVLPQVKVVLSIDFESNLLDGYQVDVQNVPVLLEGPGDQIQGIQPTDLEILAVVRQPPKHDVQEPQDVTVEEFQVHWLKVGIGRVVATALGDRPAPRTIRIRYSPRPRTP